MTTSEPTEPDDTPSGQEPSPSSPSPADQRVPESVRPDAASPSGMGLHKTTNLQGLREQGIKFLLFLCAALSIATTLGIIFVLLSESVIGLDGKAFFQQVSPVDFFTGTDWNPSEFAGKNRSFGVLPLLCGTMLIAVIAAFVGLPIGLASAVYLSEYASPRTRKIVKPTLEILAGIPTVVYGYFALVFVTPYLISGPLETIPIWVQTSLLGMEEARYFIDVPFANALSGGLVVGIMIIPMVSSLSEDALRAVPNGLREAGYALGSTKFDVSVKIVTPAAFSGIVASFILAISRAVGETMAVTLAAGSNPNLTANPLNSVQTMTAYIVNVVTGDAEVGTISYKSLYAVALTLFLMTLAMNILSQVVLARFREAYE